MNKRGGKREGAGRPPQPETKHRYNVTLSEQVANDLQMIGGGNRSAAIEEVLAYYLAHAFGVTQPTSGVTDARHALDVQQVSKSENPG